MKSKSEILHALAQTGEDHILLARALDKLEMCRARSYQTNTKFLDIRERALVEQAVRLAGAAHETVFAGGYADAERVTAIFYPTYLTAEQAADETHAPFTMLRVHKSPADSLTHRDYLGALMGLGLRRDCIGDILVQPDGADILVLREVAGCVLLGFDRAGRKRLEVVQAPIAALRAPAEGGEESEGSVASPRLDNVTALLFGLSRAEAQAQIERGTVFLNHAQCIKGQREVLAGDRITVRGMGRARVIAFTGTSRKGRQFLRFLRSQ